MRPGPRARRHDQAHRAERAVADAARSRLAGGRAESRERIMTMLEGKVAVVTGASRGIGRAIAEELGRHGAKVVGTSTSAQGAAKVPGVGKVLNVRDAGAVDAFIDEVQKQAGDIAILVNNAGIAKDNLALRMKDADWDEVIDTNLRAVFRLSRAVMRGMMKARWGRIIN